MNGDIRPRRPVQVPTRTAGAPVPSTPVVPSQTPNPVPKQPPAPEPVPSVEAPTPPAAQTPVTPTSQSPRKLFKRRRIIIIAAIVLGLIAAVVIGSAIYIMGPVKPSDTAKQSIQIPVGTAPSQIGTLLQQKGLIRSSFGFDAYTRLTGKSGQLKAGTYRLSPSQPLDEIVSHLVAGKSDQFEVTFLPGATLAEDRKVLLDSGYSASEVDAALAKTYDHPLFTTKPTGTDLEGYIYGETYKFAVDSTVEQVLTQTFDQYYDVITKNDLVQLYGKQGLTLYQGITLASIIQREVSSTDDQKQVAQVFYTRLSTGMALGSDVTFQYAAKKLGVEATPDLDSPYNTRKYTGLPPGPIAAPGLSALLAVAHPAPGDYVYFLSGDDDKTYFAHTNAEHEQNIRDHCQIKCS